MKQFTILVTLHQVSTTKYSRYFLWTLEALSFFIIPMGTLSPFLFLGQEAYKPIASKSKFPDRVVLSVVFRAHLSLPPLSFSLLSLFETIVYFIIFSFKEGGVDPFQVSWVPSAWLRIGID